MKINEKKSVYQKEQTNGISWKREEKKKPKHPLELIKIVRITRMMGVGKRTKIRIYLEA